jgi:hypothetical protein
VAIVGLEQAVSQSLKGRVSSAGEKQRCHEFVDVVPERKAEGATAWGHNGFLALEDTVFEVT